MSIKSAIVERLFGTAIEAAVQDRLPAAVGQRLEEIGWRRLTGSDTRELPMMDQDRAIEVAYWLWKTNPMGRWIVEVITAFVCAGGAPYTCDHDDVKAVLDGFWRDPVNRLDLAWEEFVRELSIYGEQCWPAFTAEQTGRVRLGYLDPAQIDQVVADPENVRLKIGVITKSKDGVSKHGKRLAILMDAENEDFLSSAGQQLRETFDDGECFLFQINALTNELRGSSDLFTVADHLDGYEQFLYDSSEKYAQFNAFFYDITVEGADEKKLENERARYQPPRTGGAFVHNEKVTASPVAPTLNAPDAQEAARLHRNHILGSIGLPEHWFGGGGDVNRATAAEMDMPSRKILEKRQGRAACMLELMFDVVIAKARAAGYLHVSDEEAAAYEVQKPEISDKDVAKLSTMLSQIAGALVTAEVQGWMPAEECSKAFAFFLQFVGYEYDPALAEEALRKARKARGYEDYVEPGDS